MGVSDPQPSGAECGSRGAPSSKSRSRGDPTRPTLVRLRDRIAERFPDSGAAMAIIAMVAVLIVATIRSGPGRPPGWRTG